MAGSILESGRDPCVDGRLVGDHWEDCCLAGASDERQPLPEGGSRVDRGRIALHLHTEQRFRLRAIFGGLLRARLLPARCLDAHTLVPSFCRTPARRNVGDDDLGSVLATAGTAAWAGFSPGFAASPWQFRQCPGECLSLRTDHDRLCRGVSERWTIAAIALAVAVHWGLPGSRSPAYSSISSRLHLALCSGGGHHRIDPILFKMRHT